MNTFFIYLKIGDMYIYILNVQYLYAKNVQHNCLIKNLRIQIFFKLILKFMRKSYRCTSFIFSLKKKKMFKTFSHLNN